MVIALIDGDIILYRVGFTTEAEEEFVARARTDDLLDSILAEVEATEWEIWLSDNKEGNFRYGIDPTYKANRVQPRPKHYECIKEHLVSKWGARFAHGMEADDALGIAQDNGYPTYDIPPEVFQTVICSIDKDLLQIPGHHYNFVKKEWTTIGPWEGIKWFYKQLLIGDTSDNVRGCSGIGPVKAGKALDKVTQSEGETALYAAVKALYRKQEEAWSEEQVIEHIARIGKLLKIKTREDEPEWFPPSLSVAQTTEQKSSSTPSKVEVSIPSTALSTPDQTSGFPPAGCATDSTSKVSPQV